MNFNFLTALIKTYILQYFYIFFNILGMSGYFKLNGDQHWVEGPPVNVCLWPLETLESPLIISLYCLYGEGRERGRTRRERERRDEREG